MYIIYKFIYFTFGALKIDNLNEMLGLVLAFYTSFCLLYLNMN